jgi:aspartate racemase
MSPATPRCLGVLGGMGPLAGAEFAVRVVRLTPASCDQEHIPMLLCNDPRVPDRSTAWVGGGPSPLPAMMRGIAMLQDAGADCIAIPCNTAHLWFDQLQAATSARLLHIVESVVLDLQRQGVHEGPIAILGTRATLETGLYQRYLAESGYQSLVPTAPDVLADCAESIAAVKGGRLDEAFAPLARAIASLVDEGARAVVLGCTELPLALPHPRRAEFGVVVTDSVDALARQAVELFTRHLPPSEKQGRRSSAQHGVAGGARRPAISTR